MTVKFVSVLQPNKTYFIEPVCAIRVCLSIEEKSRVYGK